MHGHAEVDINKAVTVGADAVTLGGSSGSGGSGAAQDMEVEKDARATARDMLLSLPGINVHNFRAVMDKVENIAELSTLSEKELATLIGSVNAKKLFNFFRRRTL